MNDKKIHEFWSFISGISKELAATPNNDNLINKIDSAVYAFGDYDWEYGPSQSKDFYFALSPNLRIDLIQEVEYIVSLAPVIENWEIISCKPKKFEPLEKWNMYNEKGEKIVVNTKEWECIIYKFPDNTIELDILINNLEGNDEIKYLAVDIHLSNIMGEKKYIQTISNFKIVAEFSGETGKRAVKVRDIEMYID